MSNRKMLAAFTIWLLMLSSFAQAHINVSTEFELDSTIFEDGFESGDTSAWDGINGNPEVVSDQSHHGSYAMRANTTREYIYKNFTMKQLIHTRLYVYWNSSLPGSGARWYFITYFNESTQMCNLALTYNGSSYHFRMYDNTSGHAYNSSAITIAANEWHAVELKGYLANGDHIWDVWYDDVLVMNQTVTAEDVDFTQVKIGVIYTTAFVAYFDCVSVSDTKIGLEDTAKPTYSNVATNTTQANSTCLFSTLWSDDVGLSHYIFSTNDTGTWSNETAVAFVANPDWSNVTKTLNNTIGLTIGWIFFANDTSNNWNNTGTQTLTTTDTLVPVASNISVNSTVANSQVLFSVFWTDLKLSGYIFSWNSSGSWSNDTWTDPWSGTPSSGWSNVSKTHSSTVGLVIGWRIFCNDTNNNMGDTTIQTVTLTGYASPRVISPENKTYASNSVALTFTLDEPASWSGYSLDGMANVTSGNTTLSGLSDGVHFVVVYANDSFGNMGSSDTVYFTIDTVSPGIEILSPENKTYTTSSVPLSFTVDEPTSWIGYSLDGRANVTITGNTALTGLHDGSHYVVVYANDTFGNMGTSSTVYFAVDTTPPAITIVSPENKTYAVKDISLTFIVSEPASWIAYSLDGQGNITITGNTTLSGLSDGSHNIMVYANDTAGNVGSSYIVYFTIQSVPTDTTPPNISITSPENKTYETTDIPLTFTVDEPVAWIAYSLD